MPREPDWMDLAHHLDKKREAMADSLPDGIECSLTLGAYGHSGAYYAVTLRVPAADLTGWGHGRTPAKALEAAKEDLKKSQAERSKRPQLGGAKQLPAKKET